MKQLELRQARGRTLVCVCVCVCVCWGRHVWRHSIVVWSVTMDWSIQLRGSSVSCMYGMWYATMRFDGVFSSFLWLFVGLLVGWLVC